VLIISTSTTIIVFQAHFVSHHGLKPPKTPILYNFEQAYLHTNRMAPDLLALQALPNF
jgi:hypothetical protein